MKILQIGGSGFVSGTLARTAVAAGHEVWAVTRGERPMPEGVTALKADRHDADAFAVAVRGAGATWDLAVDCIGFNADDVRQDVEVLRDLAAHFVLISTDFVFDPAHRQFPQPETNMHFLPDGYGGNKRAGELVLAEGDTGAMTWTVLRPCHIYGPGSKLGCLPLHGRDEKLIERLRAGEALKLVGGGHHLQQPILARDLAELALSCAGNASAAGEIFQAAGPDIVESRRYYEIIAEVLGVECRIEEVPVDAHLAENPGAASFLCHRIYDLSKSRAAGLCVPSTPIEVGLREHVESLL